MSKVKVCAYTVSLDGFGAGLEQSLELPMGKGAEGLHQWLFHTKTFQSMVMSKVDGTEGIDNDFAVKSFENIGAWIMGRNMFSPTRGPWPDDNWKGWWGPNPPYHVPVFVLTNHRKDSVTMEGGTSFHFVTEGIETALKEAIKEANGKDIRIGGGASTIRQFLRAGLIDEMHLAFSPVFLGSGEHLFKDIDLPLRFTIMEKFVGENATHVVLRKK